MSVDDELRALIVAHELGVLSEDEEARVAEALAQNPDLAKLSADASAALADPEPGPLLAPEGAWEGIASRIAEARAEDLVSSSLPILLRCTYCHDQLAREAAAYCASCLAPHHGGCFSEHGRCSVPGCGETQVVAPQLPAAPSVASPTPWRQRLLVVGAAALGLSAAAALGWSLRSSPSSDDLPPTPPQTPEPSAGIQQPDDPNLLLADAQRLLRSARDHMVLAREDGDREARERARQQVAESLAMLETAEGWMLRGLIELSEGGDAESVREDLERALAMRPDLEWAHEGLGWLAIERGEYEEACQHYQTAVAAGGDQPSEGAQLGLARALLALGRLAAAQDTLRSMVQREPTHVAASLLLAEAAASQRNFGEAIRFYSRVLELDPREVDAYLGRARCRLLQGATEQALADVDRAAALDPSRGDTWVLLAAMQQTLGREAEANEAASRAFVLGPNSVVAGRQLVIVLRGLGRTDDAAALEGQLGSLSPTSTRERGAIARLLRRVPIGGGLAACTTCGAPVEPGLHRLTLEDERPADFCSRAHLTSFLDSRGSLPPLPDTQVPDRKDPTPEAPDPPGPAQLDRAARLVEQARDTYEGAKLGDREPLRSALAELDEALQRVPDFLPAILLRARILLELGDPNAAGAALKSVTEGLQSLDGEDYVEGCLLRGRVELEARRFREAERHLTTALMMPGTTESAEAYFYLGRVYQLTPERKAENLPRAVSSFDRALELDPKLADAVFHRGAVKVDLALSAADPEQADWAAALSDLERANALREREGARYPGYAAELLLGITHASLGDPKRAEKHLTRYLEEANPGDANYPQAKKLLERLQAEGK